MYLLLDEILHMCGETFNFILVLLNVCYIDYRDSLQEKIILLFFFMCNLRYEPIS